MMETEQFHAATGVRGLVLQHLYDYLEESLNEGLVPTVEDFGLYLQHVGK